MQTVANFNHCYNYLLTLGAHALARVTVVGLSVCLSGLNLLLHPSRATRYYTYVYFTMNARFNMCGVR